MRLYGSQSRISKSATRYARAHRPIGAFDVPSARRATPIRVAKVHRTKDTPPAKILVPRSA